MSKSRRNILFKTQYAHVTFQCLNKEFLFCDDAIKVFVLKTWARFKKKYGIKIFDYVIMTNHVHLSVAFPSQTELSNFMRVTNSLIALKINSTLHRCGHALRERYKSPAILDGRYFLNTSGYIWLNAERAMSIAPERYRWCSYFSRFHKIYDPVLDTYKSAGIDACGSFQSFAQSILSRVRSIDLKKNNVYESGHTVCEEEHAERELYFRSLYTMRPKSASPPRPVMDIHPLCF